MMFTVLTLQCSSSCVVLFNVIPKVFLFWLSIPMAISFWAAVSSEVLEPNPETLIHLRSRRCYHWALGFRFWGVAARSIFRASWACDSCMLDPWDTWCYQGVRIWLCRWLYSNLCARSWKCWFFRVLSPWLCLICACSLTTTPLPSKMLTRDPSKTWHSNLCTGDWPVLAGALCRCGLWTMTVSRIGILH